MRRVLAVLIMLAAACGDDDVNQLPDGPVQPDSPPDTPTSGLVKLTITSGAAPRVGVVVYFQNSDSSEVAKVMTDASGVASAVMEAGGFVTAIDPFLPPPLPQGVAEQNLKTFAGVKPGDELVLHERARNVGTFTVNIIANSEPTGTASSYTVFGSCFEGAFGIGTPNPGSGGGSGSGSVGGSIIVPDNCGATTDLTLMARDSNTGGPEPLNAIHKTNVTIADLVDIDLTGEVYVDAESASFGFTNVPLNVGSVDVTSVLATSTGLQFEGFAQAFPDNGTALSNSIKRPVIPGALQITASRMNGSANGIHNVIEWKPAATDYSLAVGNGQIPNILLTEFTSLPAYDLAAKTVRWTVDDTVGQAPDLIVTNVSFQRSSPEFLLWSWDIAAPAANPAVAVRYPVLPAPDDRFNPTVADVFQNVNELIIAKVPGGYDTVRENVFAQDAEDTSAPATGLVVGASGLIVFEELLFGKGKRTAQTRSEVVSPFGARLRRAHQSKLKTSRR